ncbi:MAG: hypothetical protein HC810_01310 [Acaryochloridaceae cyanobacterium RL_2_7]|nr:hypothetical protein [Acaryochloridaceae cyanobacterium RL_2_7]
MNLAQALHTQARRYCQEQSEAHSQQAIAIKQTPAVDRPQAKQNLLNEYGCSEMLQWIQTEVERIDFDRLENLDSTRDRILTAAQAAEQKEPRANMGQTNRQYSLFQYNDQTVIAMNHERQQFCTAMRDLTESQLKQVLALPYQRVISIAESQDRWSQIRQKWDIKGYHWYPLHQRKLTNITAFQQEEFEDFCDSVSLVELLQNKGIKRIWELREDGLEYEQDATLLAPYYTGSEGYWTCSQLDWIIYASHGESITVGGWLLEDIKTLWPNWQQHLW